MAKITRISQEIDPYSPPFMRDQVITVEIEIEGHKFGAYRRVPEHMMYESRKPAADFVQHIKEDMKRDLGREIMDKLFPNL